MSKARVPGFDITQGKGFGITFANGRTVSVQFGGCNYCSKYDGSPGYRGPSIDAEVATFGPEGWTTREVWKAVFGTDIDDDVVGYVSPDEVAKVIAYVGGVSP